MYSTVGIIKNPKFSGRLTGTHQKLDRAARSALGRQLPRRVYFPSAKEIVYFEGNRGPDGLKLKSPGVDEPSHFIIPENNDDALVKIILDHQYNLREALLKHNDTRAAFEAAWLAHAIADGLTPAHHFPLTDIREELMSDKDFIKLFGKPIKGIMRGDSLPEAARNNWLYWGAGGYMTKHIGFEYGVALVASPLTYRMITPTLRKSDFKNIDLEKEFLAAVQRVHALNMYGRFCKDGWTSDLALEVKEILLPEAVRMIALAWYSAVPEELR